MLTTTNLNLKKPEGADIINIDVNIHDLNGNMDILDNAVANKVDKVAGKQLSTEDYTTAEKIKLAGIEEGATNYTHPANHPASIIVQDAGNRFVTDAEKTSWNAKETPAGAQAKADTVQTNLSAHTSSAAPHSGHVSHALATAPNDFLVASGAGAFVKKTPAEVKTIFGLGSAAYTDSAAYATAEQGAKADVATPQTDFALHLADYVSVNAFTGATFTDRFKAANAAIKAGGYTKKLKIPSGTHSVNEEILIDFNIDIEFDDDAILDFSAATGTFPNNACLFFTGSQTQISDLSGNISANVRSCTLTNAENLNPGDLLLFYDIRDGSFSAARTYYHNGEYVRVKSISGQVVNFDSPTFSAYTAVYTKVFKVTPVTTKIDSHNIRAKDGTTGIKVELGYRCKVKESTSSNTSYSLIYLQRCFSCWVSENAGIDYANANGTNYGVLISNCQNITVDKCFVNTTRHGIAMGGDSYDGDIPNRLIKYSNCICGNTSSSERSFDLHGNCEYITVEGCTMLDGFQFGGDHITIKNNRIFFNSVDGIYFSELLGQDISIEGNELYAQGTTNKNAINIALRTYTVRGGNIKIKHNKIVFGANYGRAMYGAIDAWGGLANDFIIEDNEIEYDAIGYPSAWSRIDISTNNGVIFNRLIFKNNNIKNAYVGFANFTVKYAEFDNNTIDGDEYGIYTQPRAADAITGHEVVLKNNKIRNAKKNAIYCSGKSDSSAIILCEENYTKDCATTSTGSTSTDAPIVIVNALYARVKNNISKIAVDDGTTRPKYGFSFITITTLEKDHNTLIGDTPATLNLYSSAVSTIIDKQTI